MALNKFLTQLTGRNKIILSVAEECLLDSIANKLAGRATLITCDHDHQVLSNVENGLMHKVMRTLANNCSDLILYIPTKSQEDLLGSLLRIINAVNGKINIFKVLYSLGFLLISSNKKGPNWVQLSGGSFSNVLLAIENGSPKILKRLELLHNEDIDRDLRLTFETQWLRKIPRDAKVLFPRNINHSQTQRELTNASEFIPWATLSELVFQNCLNENQVAERLSVIYTAVSNKLYSHGPITIKGLTVQTGYVNRIKQRTERILSYNTYSKTHILKLYQANEIEINGVRCFTQPELLENLGRDSFWLPILDAKRSTLCHGDLILEDILVDYRNPNNFKLIDPNPTNQAPIFDVSKTLMSLWLKYEFLYYDFFRITHIDIDSVNRVKINIKFDRQDCVKIFDEAANQFVKYIRENLITYLDIDKEDLEQLLRMASALQMLAIPMFHLIHHGKEERAIAFLSIGLLNATLSLTNMRIS